MIEITNEGKGDYCFYLKTRDGNTLLKSIAFADREQVSAVVNQLGILIENPLAFERKTNHQGKFLFQLRDIKGNVLGSSQLYNSEAGMENGIKNLIGNIRTSLTQ